MSEYESRLDHELLAILQTQRVAALATLQSNGTPYVSLTPYALDGAGGRVILQVSSMAPHAQHMREDPRVSLLMISPQGSGQPGATLPRITLEGHAEFLQPGSTPWQSARAVFLQRFPDSGPINDLLDFDVVALTLRTAVQTADFGASRSVSAESLQPLLQDEGISAAGR